MNDYSLHTLVKAGVPRTNYSEKQTITPKVEEEAEYQAFSYGRVGPRPQLMLEICLADGFRWCKPYIDISDIKTMNPANGFEIIFSDVTFTIGGHQLENCYRYLKQHRLESMRGSSRSDSIRAPNEEPVIDSVKVTKVSSDKASRVAKGQ